MIFKVPSNPYHSVIPPAECGGHPQEHQALTVSSVPPRPCLPQLCEQCSMVEGRQARDESQRSPQASLPASWLQESPKGPRHEQARVPTSNDAAALTPQESQHQVFRVRFVESKAHSPSSCSVSRAHSVAGTVGYTGECFHHS